MTIPAFAFIYLCLPCGLLFLLYFGRGRRLPLPPGPKRYPLIGNFYDLPHEHAWLTYVEWERKYGDIIHFSVFGTSTIVINSAKAAIELLEKRSAIYSNRPRMVMANELMGWDWDFAHMKYSEFWRRHRRLFHQYFQPRNLPSHYPYQKQKTLSLLEELLHGPQEVSTHIRRYVASVALHTAYGHEVKSADDHYINLIHEAAQPLLLVVHAGSYVVEYFPFLKYPRYLSFLQAWIPGAKFKRDAAIWYKSGREVCEVPFSDVKKSMEDGKHKPSFVSEALQNLQAQGIGDVIEEDTVMNCGAIIYFAGSDTTTCLLNSWILAMANFPEVQAKAQRELDEVTGFQRLPDFEDWAALPYVEAMLNETLRWAPVTPLGVPHCLMTEDVYEGHRIPAGATVIANTWAILHDKDVYPEPSQFKPERFLQEAGNNAPDAIIMGAFGFGRRVCPGRYFAMNSAWLAMACILSTYTISKYVDSDGTVVEPVIEFMDGLVSHPKPFKVTISPRGPHTRTIIQAAKLAMDPVN